MLKKNISRILILNITFIIYSTFYPQILSSIFGGIAWYGVILFSIVWFYRLYFKSSSIIITKSSLWFYIWIIFYIILLIFSKNSNTVDILGISFNIKVIHLVQTLIIYMIANILYKCQIYNLLIIKIYVIISFCNALFTLIALNFDANISKYMATGNPGLYTSYNTFGVVGYDYIYSLILIIPILMLICFRRKSNNILGYITLFLCVYFVFKCGYLNATIIMIVLIVVNLMIHLEKKHLLIFVLVLISLIIIYLDKELLIGAMYYLADSINVETISQRLVQIGNYLEFGIKGASLLRIDLYMYSVSSFLSSPLLGNLLLQKNFAISNHSEILDMLANGGLLLIVPFIIFIKYKYNEISINLKIRRERKVLISIIFGYVLINIVNTSFSSFSILFTMCCLVPALFQSI